MESVPVATVGFVKSLSKAVLGLRSAPRRVLWEQLQLRDHQKMSINSRYRGHRQQATTDDQEQILSSPSPDHGHPDNVIITGTRINDEPVDKYNFNYIVFYLLGMTTLLPWNFFVTAEDVSKWYLMDLILSLLGQSKILFIFHNNHKVKHKIWTK